MIGLIITLVKLRQAITLKKPAITYFSNVHTHFVVKIATSYAGAVHSVNFYARRLFLRFIPTKRVRLDCVLKDKESEEARVDSKVTRSTFRDEQLFWVTIPPVLFAVGRKYRIVARTSVGTCSIDFSPWR